MACDSRISCDTGEYSNGAGKVLRIGDALVGYAGMVSAACKFLAWYADQSKERPTFDDDDCVDAVVLTSKGIFSYSNSTYCMRIMEKHFCIGSGSSAATAAMLCGKTPAEAVKIAIKCDKHSGGPVRNYAL